MLQNATVKCKIPAMKWTDYNPEDLDYCSNVEDALKVEYDIYDMAQYIQRIKRCGNEVCNRYVYTSTYTWLSIRTLAKELKQYGNGGWYIVWPYYSSLYVTENADTYFFDFDSALVAVGGSLGLFLGWSLHSMILDPFELFYRRLFKRRTNNSNLTTVMELQTTAELKS